MVRGDNIPDILDNGVGRQCNAGCNRGAGGGNGCRVDQVVKLDNRDTGVLGAVLAVGIERLG